MTRSEAREILMQLMYEMDASGAMDYETAKKLTQERLAGNHKARGLDLVTRIIDNLEELDLVIGKGQDITVITQHLQKEFPGLPVRQIQPDELRLVGRRGKFRYVFPLGEE